MALAGEGQRRRTVRRWPRSALRPVSKVFGMQAGPLGGQQRKHRGALPTDHDHDHDHGNGNGNGNGNGAKNFLLLKKELPAQAA